MPLPPEFENELLVWLDARLSERFERQQRAVLEGVIKMVAAMLSEQIKSDGEFCRREFAGEFAKIQESVDRMQNIVENMGLTLRPPSGRNIGHWWTSQKCLLADISALRFAYRDLWNIGGARAEPTTASWLVLKTSSPSG